MRRDATNFSEFARLGREAEKYGRIALWLSVVATVCSLVAAGALLCR
jgi:hypothetical protein